MGFGKLIQKRMIEVNLWSLLCEVHGLEWIHHYFHLDCSQNFLPAEFHPSMLSEKYVIDPPPPLFTQDLFNVARKVKD